MQDKLVSFVDTLKADGRITSFDEAATKQAVIAKLLTLLGWDFFDIDEVKPEGSCWFLGEEWGFGEGAAFPKPLPLHSA